MAGVADRDDKRVSNRVPKWRIESACSSVFCLAAALVAKHDEERGAQLLGAAASLREERRIGLDGDQEEQTHERAVADAKAALGDEAFAAAWARGEAMTAEEIVAFCTAPADTNGGCHP